ncbi:MAG: FmdB family zinc ribbon protein [Ferrimicrobium sp.]
MPTYEYACRECGEHLEVVQSFYDDPLTKCLVCGGDLRKVFGNVGIVFKGSGFYKNDSRNTKRSSTPSTAQSSGASKDTESPAAASEPKTAPETKTTATSETKSSSGSSDAA